VEEPDHLDTPEAVEQPLSPPDATDDDSLILWMLSLTPTERLRAAEGFLRSIRTIRRVDAG